MGYTSYWSVLRLADDTEFDKKFAEAVEDISEETRAFIRE